jgi:hypothetical protein
MSDIVHCLRYLQDMLFNTEQSALGITVVYIKLPTLICVPLLVVYVHVQRQLIFTRFRLFEIIRCLSCWDEGRGKKRV